jgi:retron-type reverse transcriptase
MKTYKSLYSDICSLTNLVLAWKKAKKGKTKKDYVIEFEKNLLDNLLKLQEELKSLTYKPRPLKTFILRDPKIRKISKSDFRDRIVHHALCNIIEPIFDKAFIYDSCANRKGKGNLKAIERFYYFIRKVSRNGKINGWFNDNQVKGYCLKADIKHYFQEVNHEILIKIIRRKIKDEKVIWLIKQILVNHSVKDRGMPLGNLTSQFFANVYLNELDYFVKHKIKAKYYVRYVDDFVILHPSKSQLEFWKNQINEFLRRELKLELHPEKSRIIPLSKGIDFVGFRNFYYYKLLRKRNIKKMLSKIEYYKNGEMQHNKLIESFQGWQAYAKWANTYKLRNRLIEVINKR